MSGPGPTAADPSPREEQLARQYRRWLWVFPSTYRAARGDELVGVLLDRAAPSQRRPRGAEVVDLVRAGLLARARGFRTSPRRTAWSDAGSIIGILLALFLAVPSARFAVRALRIAGDPSPLHSGSLHMTDGWYAPAAWVVVVLLLGAGWTRPAMIAAWVGVFARAVALLQMANAGAPWMVQPSVVQLTFAIAAAVLLSRPTRVRSAMDTMGQRTVLAIGGFLFVTYSAWSWVSLRPGYDYLWIAIVAVLAVMTLRFCPGSWASTPGDPTARRVLIGLTSLAFAYWVSGNWVHANGIQRITHADLIATLVLGIIAIASAPLLIAAIPVALRLLPFRIGPRT